MVTKSRVKDFPVVFHRRPGINVTRRTDIPGDLLQRNVFGKVMTPAIVEVIHRGSAFF
jgi:hypothetical protein